MEQPKTFDERVELAHACTLGMDISIPTLIDEILNEVGEIYVANPDRFYLVDEGGRIAFHSGPGPFGLSRTTSRTRSPPFWASSQWQPSRPGLRNA